ncbi:hypothetical protein MNBD_GAMMA11-625 [hydrothermal vent metagenome]|uniref:DUF4157 domain-containing protein n=1 Tax=hydrothermal vent metagenome TaxID=652676 RepID=A0A3B0X383_9ZZZZ
MTEQDKFLTQIINSACNWVNAENLANQDNFRPLNSTEISIAKKVGVNLPDKIRLIEVVSMPLPADPQLKKLCDKYEFMGDNSIGLTLGYPVYIRKAYLCTRLLSHEFRHVQQYEQCGSIQQFLLEYITQVMHSGYLNAPFEIDARDHEFDRLTPASTPVSCHNF